MKNCKSTSEDHAIEGIHEMIADHNQKSAKVFYYTEDEVKKLCRASYYLSHHPVDRFNDWFENVKKK